MNCKETEKLLSAYQDGRLSPEEKARLKDHLAACSACREEDRMLSNAWSMLKALKPIEPSPDFRTRFWVKAREEEKSEWREYFYLARPAFMLASLILVALLGTLAALKLMPQDAAARQYKSPVIQWADSTSDDIRSGGFSL